MSAESDLGPYILEGSFVSEEGRKVKEKLWIPMVGVEVNFDSRDEPFYPDETVISIPPMKKATVPSLIIHPPEPLIFH